MKNRILIYIAGGTLALYFAANIGAQSPNQDAVPKVPQAWRHLALEHEGKSVTDQPELARKINSLGDEGWQLVDVESIAEGGTTTRIVFFFKRPN
jgi:hypothetical protein